ncbi:MAG TPA: DUF2269 family protein [Gaiellaceae bacterium]|nr:DUF2269 family protein [Gaiellaceae bacterium]
MAQWLLFFHLVGAFCLVSGAVVAGTLQLAALRRERPSEIAILLRTTRAGVLLVVLGAVLALVFGIALASNLGYGLSPAWIQAALGLWLASVALGALGGRTAREARHLAERLAAEGDRPSDELRSLVAHRPSLLLSYASSVLVVAIVVLMVWRPT